MKVSLVDGTPSSHRDFESHEALDSFLKDAGAAKAVEVNRTVWETAKHALTPEVAAVFDENLRVVAGERTYTVTRDGIYSQSIGEDSPRTELYYGEDGTAELHEHGLVAANSGMPSALRELELRNPHIQAIADRIIEAGGLIDPAESGGAKVANLCGGNYFWDDCKFVSSPGGQQAFVNGQAYTVRFVIFNESYGGTFSKKGKAGTQPQVLISGGQWAAVGVQNPYQIGEHLGYDAAVFGRGTYNETDPNYKGYDSCQGRPYIDQPPYLVQISCTRTLDAVGGRAHGYDAISRHIVRVNNTTSNNNDLP